MLLLRQRWHKQRTETLRGHWANIWSAVGCLVVVVLLFRPWMKVPGWDGQALVDGFGHMDVSTRYINLWSKTGGAPIPNIGGTWAILTCASTLVAVACVVYNIYSPTPVFVRVARISIVATAVFVLLGVQHVYAAGQEVKAMLGSVPDLGGQVGLLMQAVFHTGPLMIPGIRNDPWRTASLTPWAFLAIAVSLISAMVVLATSIPRHSDAVEAVENHEDSPPVPDDAAARPDAL